MPLWSSHGRAVHTCQVDSPAVARALQQFLGLEPRDAAHRAGEPGNKPIRYRCFCRPQAAASRSSQRSIHRGVAGAQKLLKRGQNLPVSRCQNALGGGKAPRRLATKPRPGGGSHFRHTVPGAVSLTMSQYSSCCGCAGDQFGQPAVSISAKPSLASGPGSSSTTTSQGSAWYQR